MPQTIKSKIPTIDLNEDTSRQIIIDQEPGRYLGHPSTVLLSDKTTMIAVYIMGHGRGQVVMKRSVDGGLTWSNRLAVPESWSTLLQVPVIYSVTPTASESTERLLLFTGHYPIRLSVSEDKGMTWSELKAIGDFGGNVSMSDVIQLKNGDYMGIFHDDGRFIDNSRMSMKHQLYKSTSKDLSKVEFYTSDFVDGKWEQPKLDVRTAIHTNDVWEEPQLIYEAFSGKRELGDISKIYKTLSSDGGLTWNKPVPIVWHEGAYLAEGGLIYSPDKSQMAVIMRENHRKFNSFVSYSNDEGVTWSQPTEVANELTGDRHKICYAPDGRLVAIFRDTHALSPTHGDWVVWVGTYQDMIAGKSGQYRIRLKKNYFKDDCGYSGLELLPDDTFVATTYGHWIENEAPYIISVRFKLSDLEKELII